MPRPEVFHSEFLKTASPGLRRRRDYGSEPIPEVKTVEDRRVENLYHLRTALRQARESLRRAGVYSSNTRWTDKLRLCCGAVDEILDEVADAIPYQGIGGPTASKTADSHFLDKSLYRPGNAPKLPSDASSRSVRVKGKDGRTWVLVDWQVVYGDMEPDEYFGQENYVPEDEDYNVWLTKEYGPFNSAGIPGRLVSIVRSEKGFKQDEAFPKSVSVTAATGSAPREYPVKKKEDGFWYIVGLPGEGLTPEGFLSPTMATPDSWLSVHQDAENLDLAEQLYRELYAEFQTNDNLKKGDTFDTPAGQFICQGVDVLPFDDKAKKAIAAVDESYKCQACGCDQGQHRKAIGGYGCPYYAECGQHPECREYIGKPTRGGAE